MKDSLDSINTNFQQNNLLEDKIITDFDQYREALKGINEYWMLQNVSSFGDITSNFPFSLNKLVTSFQEIIQIKDRDNQFKTNQRETIRRLELEKVSSEKNIKSCQSLNNDLNNKIQKLEEKIAILVQTQNDKDKEFNTEKLILIKEKNKYETRYAQMQFEKKKIEREYDRNRDSILKEQDKANHKNLDLFPSKPGIDISYYLNTKEMLIPKHNFVQDFNKYYEEKYKHITLENEKMRNFIVNINKEIKTFVDITKEYFFATHKNVFGADYENKEELKEDSNFPLNFNIIQIDDMLIGELLEAFKMNFNKVKEFIEKNFKLKNLMTNTLVKSKKTKEDYHNQNNKTPDNNNMHINEDYTFLIDTNKEINLELINLYESILKERNDNSDLFDICSKYEKIDQNHAKKLNTNLENLCKGKLSKFNEEFKIKYKNSKCSENENETLESELKTRADLEDYVKIAESIMKYNEEIENRINNSN